MINGPTPDVRRVFSLAGLLMGFACSATPDAPDPTAQSRNSSDPTLSASTAKAAASEPPAIAGEPSTQNLNTRERLSRDPGHLVLGELPNGTPKLHLGGRFQQAAVARIGANGKIERSCVETPEALDRWLGSTEPKTGPLPAGTQDNKSGDTP